MKIKINSKEYYKVPAIKVMQNNYEFFLLSLPVDVLLELASFQPANYAVANSRYAELELSKDTISSDTLNYDYTDEDFNRELDKDKLKSLRQFVTNEENIAPVLPNSLILATPDKNDYFVDESNLDPSNPDNPLEWQLEFNSIGIGSYFHNNFIYLPRLEKSILVVDGQHRLAGFIDLEIEIEKKLNISESLTKEQLVEKAKNEAEKIRKNYHLPISLLVGDDNPTLSSLFYTINDTQKPVNPSMLKYMTSQFLQDLQEEKLVHEFIKILNEKQASPLFKEIKMFGVGPGLVSFSVLYDYLLSMLLKTTKRSSKIPICRDIFETTESHFIILNIYYRFFSALKIFTNNGDKTIKTWNKDTVYNKTIGISTFLMLLPSILLKILDKKYTLLNTYELEKITLIDFLEELEELNSLDVSNYKKGGGMGTAKELREEIKKVLELDKYNKERALQVDWINKYCI